MIKGCWSRTLPWHFGIGVPLKIDNNLVEINLLSLTCITMHPTTL